MAKREYWKDNQIWPSCPRGHGASHSVRVVKRYGIGGEFECTCGERWYENRCWNNHVISSVAQEGQCRCPVCGRLICGVCGCSQRECRLMIPDFDESFGGRDNL